MLYLFIEFIIKEGCQTHFYLSILPVIVETSVIKIFLQMGNSYPAYNKSSHFPQDANVKTSKKFNYKNLFSFS